MQDAIVRTALKLLVVGFRSWRRLAIEHLGPDGLPVRHRVIHVIEALADGVDRVPYRAGTMP